MPGRAQAVFDSIDDRTDLPLDTVEFLLSAFVIALARSIQPVQLAVILGGKFLDEFGGDKVGLQSRKNTCLEEVSPDRQKIVASSAIARVRAAVMVQAHLGEPAPTGAALEQVREQIDGATGALGANADIVVRQGMPNTKLPSLHLVPELVIDDAQVRYVLRDPLVRRVRPSLSLAGCRILDKALPVPDELADIELVVQHSSAPSPVAVDC